MNRQGGELIRRKRCEKGIVAGDCAQGTTGSGHWKLSRRIWWVATGRRSSPSIEMESFPDRVRMGKGSGLPRFDPIRGEWGEWYTSQLITMKDAEMEDAHPEVTAAIQDLSSRSKISPFKPCLGTTLNVWMMVERYPNLKEEVGAFISSCEISST